MKLDEKDGRDVLKPNNLGIPHPPRFDRRDSFCSFGRMDGWTEKSQSKFTTQARLERANARERETDRTARGSYLASRSRRPRLSARREKEGKSPTTATAPPHTHTKTHTHTDRETRTDIDERKFILVPCLDNGQT